MSDKKVFKFNFVANIRAVNLALKFPCVVSVIWKRGQKAAQVRQRKQIEKGVVTFNQKLQIECNMQFNNAKQIFQEKKTKFNILIFSEKGNKQAGQVYLDVAQLLNSKKQQMHYEKNLDKCPDKNAKLIFDVSGYMKSQIEFDEISKASTRTYDIAAITDNVKPDFKKKKKEESVEKEKTSDVGKVVNSSNQLKVQENTADKAKNAIKSQKTARQNLSVNADKLKYNKLEQENKKLKQQMRQLKQMQVQNQNLKRQFQEAQKVSMSYYKKIFDEMKKQYNENKSKSDQQKALIKKKEQMQKQMCDCKQKMGRILNFALMSGNSALSEQFYNIYQNKNMP